MLPNLSIQKTSSVDRVIGGKETIQVNKLKDLESVFSQGGCSSAYLYIATPMNPAFPKKTVAVVPCDGTIKTVDVISRWKMIKESFEKTLHRVSSISADGDPKVLAAMLHLRDSIDFAQVAFFQDPLHILLKIFNAIKTKCLKFFGRNLRKHQLLEIADNANCRFSTRILSTGDLMNYYGAQKIISLEVEQSMKDLCPTFALLIKICRQYFLIMELISLLQILIGFLF